MVVVDDIKRLIELDFKYQEKVKAAHDEKLNLDEELSLIKKDMKDKAWQEVTQCVNDRKVTLNSEVKDEIKKNDEIYNKEYRKLHEKFLANKDTWINELVKKTTAK